MKRLLLPVLAVSAMVLGSCSTQKLAQQSNDDVYFTEAKAKEVTFAVREERKEEKNYRTDEQLYGGGDYADDRYYDDYNYDYGYASRIGRFYGRSPWRSAYYDSWYAYGYNPWYTYRYDPFFYDPWYYRPGVNVWVGIGSYPRYGLYDNWGFYGSPYAGNYWGPYSYYNVYPGVGYGNGGYYGGGYYSGGRTQQNRRRPTYTDPNYNGSNRGGYTNGQRTEARDGSGRVMNTPSRGERWGTGSSERVSSSGSNGRTSEASRPQSSRGNSSDGSSRSQRPEPRYEPRPSTQSSTPPPSISGDSGGNSGGGSSRSSRPSRAGGN